MVLHCWVNYIAKLHHFRKSNGKIELFTVVGNWNSVALRTSFHCLLCLSDCNNFLSLWFSFCLFKSSKFEGEKKGILHPIHEGSLIPRNDGYFLRQSSHQWLSVWGGLNFALNHSHQITTDERAWKLAHVELIRDNQQVNWKPWASRVAVSMHTVEALYCKIELLKSITKDEGYVFMVCLAYCIHLGLVVKSYQSTESHISITFVL